MLPVQWAAGALCPGVKRPGRKPDHSPRSSAEVKKVGAIPPLPRTSSWRNAYIIKHRGIFTFFMVTADGYLETLTLEGPLEGLSPRRGERA
jgi:hypothetical protein